MGFLANYNFEAVYWRMNSNQVVDFQSFVTHGEKRIDKEHEGDSFLLGVQR